MSNTQQWHNRALKVMPGGVNSPVRQGVPSLIEHASGAYVTTIEQEKKIDYVGGFGPAILGHSHPKVVSALQQALSHGLCYGATNPHEIILGEMIQEVMPNIERIRFVNSGTEASMTVARIARAATKRDKIIKCIGGYHGHSDAFLVAAGSGALTHGAPSSAGVPKATVQDTLLVPYNDLQAMQDCFTHFKDEIAAILIEPVAGNMGMILPKEGYLQGLRDLCDQHQSLLIFDEVMSGFRVAHGGAQSIYGIKPDLTMLGKIIGGGFPIGAIGGKKELMEQLSPIGDAYQAGTLSGNPMAMMAGIATLNLLTSPSFYKNLSEKIVYMLDEITNISQDIPITSCHLGGMFGLFFSDKTVNNFDDATTCNADHFKIWFKTMWDEGIFFAPSPYEAAFISEAHGTHELNQTIQAAKKAFSNIQKEKHHAL